MSAKQLLVFAEQDTSRHLASVTPVYMAYPVKGKLEPEPEYKEEAPAEWRAQDVAQGSTGDNEERTSTGSKYLWESRIYPGGELALLHEFVYGTSLDPVALASPNAAAQRTMYHSTSEMYGEGTQLLDRALALIPQTRKGSGTYGQVFLGHRPKDLDLSFKGGEAAEMKSNMMSGPWIGAPEQAAITGTSFPASKAFRSVPKVYLGAGATLTGAAPAYTDFAPGTMPLVKPDDLTIKMELGIEDVWKMNGFEGPSVTERKKAFMLTAEFTVDFADPSSGWSSYDAWKDRFSGITHLPFMMILNSSEIIPSCEDQTYQIGIYLPRMKVITDQADRKNDGSKDKIKVKLESRVDPAVNIACFAKLIC